MAQIPNIKLELHPSMFDLLMTVLAYNAANAPVESVRSGAKDLMEKRMRSIWVRVANNTPVCVCTKMKRKKQSGSSF